VRHTILQNHGAVGQISRRQRQDMQTLAAAGETFEMQHRVDVARFGYRHLSVSRKSPLECLSRRSSAQEAWSMSGGEARRFVQEEQFGPTAGRHDGATDTAPVEGAYQPRPTGPAPLEQRAGLRIVDDPPISSEVSPLGRGHDVGHGCDAILERHDFNPERRVPLHPRHSGGADQHIGNGPRNVGQARS
jgi:hypothetical protein